MAVITHTKILTFFFKKILVLHRDGEFLHTVQASYHVELLFQLQKGTSPVPQLQNEHIHLLSPTGYFKQDFKIKLAKIADPNIQTPNWGRTQKTAFHRLGDNELR